jgi:hypothetical protein
VKTWLALVRPGDWLVVSLAGIAVALSFPLLWRGGPADRAVIRLDGRIVAEYPLNAARRVEVTGPIGTTVVEIQPGRARVFADPGPRQYCVRQGWLTRASAIAICAPNHVSLALAGGQTGYDSLNY